MSNADRHNPPPSGDAAQPDPASEAAPVSGAPPAHLSSTMKTGSAFKSTWRMPSVRPVAADPAQSGVRRLDLPELPSPNSGRTLHDLFSAPPPPVTPGSPSRIEPNPRSGVTLTDLPSAPPPGAPRGDWARSVTVGPRTADAYEVGRRDRVTDPLGGLRLSPSDLRPQQAEPASVQPVAAPPEPAPGTPSQPARAYVATDATNDAAPAPVTRPSRRAPAPEPIPGQRSLPWGLMTTAVVLIAGLGSFAWWRNHEQARPAPRMNLVLPLVQAPAEAEPVRTSVKVAERTTLEPGAPVAAADAPTRAPSRPPSRPAANLPPGVPQTLIESMPPGAEVVLRGAVIANTPARVQLAPYESEYLLRKDGYLPELIRIDPGSPERIEVHLRPASE